MHLPTICLRCWSNQDARVAVIADTQTQQQPAEVHRQPIKQRHLDADPAVHSFVATRCHTWEVVIGSVWQLDPDCWCEDCEVDEGGSHWWQGVVPGSGLEGIHVLRSGAWCLCDQ
jgi:hypothetical protein